MSPTEEHPIMSTNPDNNRSSALSPEAIAMINSATSAAVSEAVKAVFASLAPMMKEMAITPEKLREANKPYIDPAKAARELRETLKFKQDEQEQILADRARKAQCPHIDKNGRPSIFLVHNQPDHQPRGICVVCHDWIHPREWRIGPADEKNPRGKAVLVDPHKDYRIVTQLESYS
jgi:hypothetical protein